MKCVQSISLGQGLPWTGVFPAAESAAASPAARQVEMCCCHANRDLPCHTTAWVWVPPAVSGSSRPALVLAFVLRDCDTHSLHEQPAHQKKKKKKKTFCKDCVRCNRSFIFRKAFMYLAAESLEFFISLVELKMTIRQSCLRAAYLQCWSDECDQSIHLVHFRLKERVERCRRCKALSAFLKQVLRKRRK